jgi:hypothetical protein
MPAPSLWTVLCFFLYLPNENIPDDFFGFDYSVEGYAFGATIGGIAWPICLAGNSIMLLCLIAAVTSFFLLIIEKVFQKTYKLSELGQNTAYGFLFLTTYFLYSYWMWMAYAIFLVSLLNYFILEKIPPLRRKIRTCFAAT